MINFLSRFFTPKVDRKALDRLAQARPIHESFYDLAKRLSKGDPRDN